MSTAAGIINKKAGMWKKWILLIGILTVLSIPVQANTPCDAAEDCNAVRFGLDESAIRAYPEPDVMPLETMTDLMHDRWYKQITESAAVYDAPGGSVIRTIDAGFNFVTALSEENGWTQINTGEWVLSDQLANSNGVVSSFTGIFLPEAGLPYPLAWTLVNLYPSKTPGGDPAESNGLMYRYTRVNLYTAVEVDGFQWYQIGVDKWVHQFNVAQVLPVERPADVTTERWISIDLYEQIVIAYEGATPVFATLIATGLDRWPTREGTYHIYFRRTRKNMSGGTPGDDYYSLEEVPWTMFFDEGRALHGAYWHDGFGYRRSHGCVNLSISDAHWLYMWVAEVMGSQDSPDVEEGPAVYVYSSGDYQ